MIDNLPLIYIKIRNLDKEIKEVIDSNSFNEKSNSILDKIDEIEGLIKENLKENNFWIAGASYKELISVLNRYKDLNLIEKKIVFLKRALVDVIYNLLDFENNPIVEVRIVNTYSDILPEIKTIVQNYNNKRISKYSLYNISENSIEFISTYLEYVKDQFVNSSININDVLYILRLNFFEDLGNKEYLGRDIDILVNFLYELFELSKNSNIKVLQFLSDLFNFYNEAKKNKDDLNNLIFNFYDVYLRIVNKLLLKILSNVNFNSIEFRISFYERIFRFYYKVGDYFKSFILALLISYYNYQLKDFYNCSLYFFRTCDIVYSFCSEIIKESICENDIYNISKDYRFFPNLYFLFLNLAINLYFYDSFSEQLEINLKLNSKVNNFFKTAILNFYKDYNNKKNNLFIQKISNLIFNLDFRDYIENKSFLKNFGTYFDSDFYKVLEERENWDSLVLFIINLFDANKNNFSSIFLKILTFIFQEYYIKLN